MPLSRRQFLAVSAAAALPPGLARAIDPIKRPSDKPDLKLSLAAYSFNKALDRKKPAMTLFEFIDFADVQEATLDFNLDQMALARYAEYWPLPGGIKLVDGAFTSRLTVAFTTEKRSARAVTMTGTARLDRPAVTRRDGSPTFATPRSPARRSARRSPAPISTRTGRGSPKIRTPSRPTRRSLPTARAMAGSRR